MEAEEISLFSELLLGVASWLEAKGQPLWAQDMLSPEALLRRNRLNEFYLAFLGEQPAACMVLQEQDEDFWPNDTGTDALYLHKLAVHRMFAGQGLSQSLIEYAKEEAKARGKRFLKLDTAAKNEKLNRLYQSYGFSYSGIVMYGVFEASLYQLDLTFLSPLS